MLRFATGDFFVRSFFLRWRANGSRSPIEAFPIVPLPDKEALFQNRFRNTEADAPREMLLPQSRKILFLREKKDFSFPGA